MNTTHWECGSADIPTNWLQEFVDDNVYAALKEYGAEASLQLGNGSGATFDPDRVLIYLAEGRNKEDEYLGAIVSLRKTMLDYFARTTREDGSYHPEDCDNTLKVAAHLEAIAADLKAFVSSAEKVNVNHVWK